MLAFDREKVLVVAKQAKIKLISKTSQQVCYHNGLGFLAIDASEIDWLSTMCNGEYPIRYLDRFILLIPEDQNESHEIFTLFFDSIADNYEEYIDRQRNLDNIHNLLSILSSSIGPLKGKTILDFGCGTGLSMEFSSEFAVNLVGVDASQGMRTVASSKGMTVWSYADLTKCPPGGIYGCIASYVLHLPQNDHIFSLIWSKMGPGGILVGNIHKSQRLKSLEQLVFHLSGTIKYLTQLNNSSIHGDYIACIKGN